MKLTKEEKEKLYKQQLALVQRIKAGDQEAFDELFQQTHGLIECTARKIHASTGSKFNLDYEDFYQEAVIGYLQALEKYDETYEINFSGLAYQYIKWGCHHYVTDICKVTSHDRKYINIIREESESGMSDEEIMKKYNINKSRFIRLKDDSVLKRCVNFEELISPEAKNYSEAVDDVLSHITDKGFSSVEDELINSMEEADTLERYAQIQNFIETSLSPFEKTCLCSKDGAFGFSKKKQYEIAEEYGVKAHEVSKTAIRARKKLLLFCKDNNWGIDDLIA